MAIYFLRHGQSQANVNHVFAGQRDDAPLTALGKRQARTAARGKHLKIDRLISSPSLRARQTAVEFAEEMGFEVEDIEFDNRILEYDMGSFTGTRIRKLTKQQLMADPLAEDLTEFHQRIFAFLKDLKANQHPSEEILVVSHSGVGIAIEAAKRGLGVQSFYGLPPYPNALIVELRLDWLNETLLAKTGTWQNGY